MATIQITLDAPRITDLTTFADDQVLTAEQLNDVGTYFDDQARLTRTKLSGVGVICGLRVSVANGIITVTKGAGVTTDGDLLAFDVNTPFDRYKAYDSSNPTYAPFNTAAGLIPIYVLTAQSAAADTTLTSLTQFETLTGKSLSDPAKSMVAVLFMQSYLKSNDQCSGTDCDSQGPTCSNQIMLLLVDRSSVGALLSQVKPLVPTTIAPIAADRVALDSSLTTYAQLAARYTTACAAIQNKLAAALPNLYAQCSTFLPDIFVINPTVSWLPPLNNFAEAFSASATGIQYYYDFLKDVVETYNELYRICNELLVLTCGQPVCCPSVDLFPKHLLLGDVTPGSNPDQDRTPFYPSPAIRCDCAKAGHALFLVRKLDALIRNFQLPAVQDKIIVTPSFFEDRSLEDRAIPYYYQVSGATPMQTAWNYELHEEGRDAWNYSYNAPAYGAQGGAANPFGSQIGRFPFFRVEGHLGINVSRAISEIETAISSNNLPFAVRAVFLGADSTGVVLKPGLIYTDLNRFHYLVRQDVVSQLNDSIQFSPQLNSAVASKVQESEAPGVIDQAAKDNTAFLSSANSAVTKLNRAYLDYAADPTWKTDVQDTVAAASNFKYNVASAPNTDLPRLSDTLVKTEFSTPFDALIAGSRVYWPDWLDQIILARNQQENDKVVFKNFISRFPGVEHFAGVLRGGTLILVHDTSNNVVADFMVPFYLPDPTQPQPPEPPLTRTWPYQGAVDGYGVRVTQPSYSVITSSLTTFQKQIQPQIDLQEKYLDTLQKSFEAVATTFSTAVVPKRTATTFQTVSDPVLNSRLAVLNAQQTQVVALAQQVSQPNPPAATTAAYQAAQADLAATATAIATDVSSSGTTVAPGTDAYTALMQVHAATQVITDPTATTTYNTSLTSLAGTTPNTTLKTFIQSGVLNR